MTDERRAYLAERWAHRQAFEADKQNGHWPLLQSRALGLERERLLSWPVQGTSQAGRR